MDVLIGELRRILGHVEEGLEACKRGDTKKAIPSFKMTEIGLRRLLGRLMDLTEVLDTGKLNGKTIEIALALLLHRPATLTEVARKTGVSKERVRQVKETLRKAGVRVVIKKEARESLMNAKFEAALKLVMGGKSLREACRKLRVDYDAMRKLFRERGLDFSDLRTRSLIEKIQFLIRQGLNMKEIARETGYSYDRIRKIINATPFLKAEYELNKTKRNRKNPGVRHEKKKMIIEMLKRGLSPGEIAAMLDTYESYVYKIKGELKRREK